jgi:hypothetical protein
MTIQIQYILFQWQVVPTAEKTYDPVSNNMEQQQISVGSMLIHLLEDNLKHPFQDYSATFHGTCQHFHFGKLFTKRIYGNAPIWTSDRDYLHVFVLFITSSRLQDSFLPCTYNYQAHSLTKYHCAMVRTPASWSTFWKYSFKYQPRWTIFRDPLLLKQMPVQ